MYPIFEILIVQILLSYFSIDLLYNFSFFLSQLQGNLENELQVLEDLIYIFDDMIDNIGEIDLDDR